VLVAMVLLAYMGWHYKKKLQQLEEAGMPSTVPSPSHLEVSTLNNMSPRTPNNTSSAARLFLPSTHSPGFSGTSINSGTSVSHLDKYSETLTLHAATSAEQSDTEGIMHVSHGPELTSQVLFRVRPETQSANNAHSVDSSSAVCNFMHFALLQGQNAVQGPIDHLEVRAGGTTGGLASRASSHECEMLSASFSERGVSGTQSPQHLNCEEQNTGSWDQARYDQAAAEMQGDDHHLPSALNDVRTLSTLIC
jgi:hypothetical protein